MSRSMGIIRAAARAFHANVVRQPPASHQQIAQVPTTASTKVVNVHNVKSTNPLESHAEAARSDSVIQGKKMLVCRRTNGTLTLIETPEDSSASSQTFQEYRNKHIFAEYDEYAVAKSASGQIYFAPFVRPDSSIVRILVEFKELNLEQIYHLEKEVQSLLTPMKKAFGKTLPPYGHNRGIALGETKTHAYKAKGDEVWTHGTMEFSIPFEHVAILGGIGELYGVTFVGDKMACMGMMDLL
ncbi:hypothetical protein CB0940_06457 [Cercospora beticola]|uniref:Uncharacterized protein n=1 Tax=Cercospora beticola TaxID=122368 RepID=A0A2G5I061_CERBT|nr:hypothetical protein CB0940_06457 [Cercospora beticola]PIA97872.1 hypothetical protein CB0940_06457 [Cercospora beticola]WPA99095.1 hypothetical protein RHO25_003710 [Cercospora beticola]CAK1360403.1 unnamed protein product [Cercospora beticola]